MNDPTLLDIWRAHKGRYTLKWDSYLRAYDRHLGKLRHSEMAMLEIGVFAGGSLEIWREYFGSKADIYGIDIRPECKLLEKEGFKIFIGSQSDIDFLRQTRSILPPMDVIVDDGGHMMRQQSIAFTELFGTLKEGGWYICEDLHTSYWPSFGGGHLRRGSFIEGTKQMIDQLNAWFSKQRNFKPSNLAHSVASIHFYPGIVFIEKGRMSPPIEIRQGAPQPMPRTKNRDVKKRFIDLMEEVLARLRIRSPWH